MTPNYQILLIAVVFASQIIVLSLYTPLSWQRYRTFLFKLYPREEYPRLYPLPREQMERKFALFRALHLSIGVGAALTLVCDLIYGPTARSLNLLMGICFFVQLLPGCVAVPLEDRIKQAFRAMPPPCPRSAELRKWRATDFVSPLWIGLGSTPLALALTSALVLYLYRPGTLGVFPAGFLSAAALLVLCNRLFGNAGLNRADPYMSMTDTFRVRQRNYRRHLGISAGFGAYLTFMLLQNAGLVRIDAAYMGVGFSVFFQLQAVVLVSWLNRSLGTRDFSVYRADRGAQAAP
ncbi:MAG: hypothetical protein ACREUT_06530 [Steroidobacteraceae bacterium]